MPRQIIEKEDLKRKYCRLFIDIIGFYYESFDKAYPFPLTVKQAIYKYFGNYFYYSITLCRMRVENPPFIYTLTNDSAVWKNFVNDLEIIFHYDEISITLLLDPNFRENIITSLRESGKLDVKKEVTFLLEEKYPFFFFWIKIKSKKL